MGFADLLIMLGIPYGTTQSLQLAERVMDFITTHAHDASRALAAAGRGPFPAYRSAYRHRRGDMPIRNATLTTIAPTGTISILAGVSSGIEPVFALAFTRCVLEGRQLREIHPLLLQTLEQRHLLSPDLLAEVVATGSLQTIAGIPADLKALFVTSHDMAPETHVRMQAAFQCHTDNAVSKTVNLPATATPAEVERVVLLAHDLNCKGITVFRDRCKSSQVLSLGIPTYGEPISGSDRRLAGLEFAGECRNCTV